MLGRISLFVLTNILVLITVAIITSLFGLDGMWHSTTGFSYGSLFVFCLIWGMVGAFISLAISRWAAKMMLRVQVLDPAKPSEYDWLVAMVHDLSKRAGLPAMPEVGVFRSDTVNAFATGPTKSRSLVAFSTGLLASMNRDEIEGVAAHEVAHIQNGDMVTMTLIQGVINAFVLFFARIVASAASRAVRQEFSWIVYLVSVIAFQIIFGMLGAIVTCWFSRKREFRADAASARLAGRDKMIAALESLKRDQRREHEHQVPEAVAALGISSKPSKLSKLWSTHPDLDLRIEALRTGV